MTDIEAKQYINDLIDKLRIMKNTTSYKEDITNYIDALKICYSLLNNKTYKNVSSLIDDVHQISIDDLLDVDSSNN